jgi:hypothetical protein
MLGEVGELISGVLGHTIILVILGYSYFILRSMNGYVG